MHGISRRGFALLGIVFLLPLAVAGSVRGEEAIYPDDEEIVRTLREIKPGESLLLPPLAVHCGDLKMYGMEKLGPGQRDYCNRMPYAPDRQTALYAGGNHQVPHRMNDVWEFHLGSNSWRLLYEPDGGNPGVHKGAYFLTSRTLVQNPEKELTEQERESIEAYRVWWNENVVLENGHLATTRGGPIMPAHTWDAFCYDPRAKRLLWGSGAVAAAQLSTHAYFANKPIEAFAAQHDPNYSPMWMFDPFERRWSQYRTDGPRAELRGMGATMTYLPDRGQSLYYVAAQNVSPASYEMWLFDAVEDRWTELRPNGGKTIGELAGKEQIAPMSEQQTAYSPKHKKLLAVDQHNTFVYDLEANTWAKIDTNKGIWGHDAHSVLAYDDRCDTFLLAFPPEGRGKAMKLAGFTFERGEWEILEPKGPPIPETKYGSYMGYFDPRFGLFVIQGRNNDRMWVYRHEG